MNISTKGFASLLLVAFMFGTWGILSRYLGQSFDLFYQFWTRYLFLSSTIFVVLILTKKWKNIERTKLPWFALRVILGFISIVSIYLAFNAIAIGTAYFASYAGTVIGGFIIGTFFFRERLHILKIIALILSLVGLYVIYFADFNPAKFFYIFLAIVSGLTYAAWYSCSRKISDSYSTIQITFIDYFTGFIFALIFSFLLKETWILPSLTFPWFINLMFAITSVITGIFLIYGFKRVEIQIGTIILLTEVIFGIIFGYIFFREIITTSIIFGGSLIFIATCLPLFLKRQKMTEV